tara:strand:+ start:1187 stop:1516 length:330 start_codon:yes stop_codon:yes gene_type:complete
MQTRESVMKKNKIENKSSVPEESTAILGAILLIISVVYLIYSLLKGISSEDVFIIINLFISSLLLLVLYKIVFYLRDSNYLAKKNQEILEELNYNIRQINVKVDKIQAE